MGSATAGKQVAGEVPTRQLGEENSYDLGGVEHASGMHVLYWPLYSLVVRGVHGDVVTGAKDEGRESRERHKSSRVLSAVAARRTYWSEYDS